MSIWRPQQNILVKARGLVWRDGLLLANEIYLDDGSIKGVRPLGGRLEFGETWRDALVREFDEELGVAVEVIGKPMVLENIFTHQGVIGARNYLCLRRHFSRCRLSARRTNPIR